MKATNITLLVALTLSGGACKDNSTNSAPATTETSAAAPKAANATAKTPETPAAPAEVSVDDFAAKIVPAACRTIDQCKNDKMKVVVTSTVMMVASFGSMDKPDLREQVSPIGTAMKADKRMFPTQAECKTVGDVALKVSGLDPAFIKAKTGKTVSYDGKKAAACLAAIEAPSDTCKEDVKLAAEPKFGELASLSEELKPALDALMKPCAEVVSGLVEVDGACELAIECKGEDVTCRPGKKDPKARTCQPKKK